ncbi:MAG: metal ABC transporter ATP-binding protein, partial [Chloroflexi bacterium]|nr:metal ABC transporter ATP-binding protein [Chloroflexota bacterium]
FTGVDVTTQEATLDLLPQLREQNVTVLVSTHDLSMAAQRFDQVLLLNRRLIASGDPRQVFRPEVVRQAFGGQVLFMDGAVMAVDQCCPHEEH